MNLENKYVILRDLPDIEASFQLFTENEALIKILKITEGNDFAGYFIEFQPIVGNFKKFLNDTKILKDYSIGILSYSQAVRISETMRLEHTPEYKLNNV